MKKSIVGSVLLVLMLSTVIFGQGTSRITGVVKDTTGAIIPGATVTITHEGTNISSKMTSTSAGIYVFDGMQLGSYTLTVEMNGFKKYVSKGNILTLGVPLTVNAAMEAGAVNETVEVSGAYERVQTSTSGNFGTTLDSKALVDLPLGLEASSGGRNPLNFISLQPGVVSGANSGGGVHVNGARDRAFNFTLDGIDINETSAGGANFSPLRTNPDSLQEMRIITGNSTAEYGRNSGAQVMLVTKSGTNQIHGNLFYFHRNSALSANEWENNLNGISKPSLRQHQFGGDIGGPILKNKTFYFFNTQIQRQIIPVSTDRTVLTDSAKRGIYRYVQGDQNRAFGQTGSAIDANGNALLPACISTSQKNCIATYNISSNDPRKIGIDPIIQSKVLKNMPSPNNFSLGDGLNTAGYTFIVPRRDPQRDFVFKLDHTFNDNHSIFGRYAWGNQNTFNDTGNAGGPAFPGLPTKVNTYRDPKNLAVGHKWVITPSIMNEFTVGINHFSFNFETPTDGDELYSIVGISLTDPFVFTAGNQRSINTYQFVDNLSFLRGSHSFKTGINFRYQQHKDARGSLAGVVRLNDVNYTVNSEPMVIIGGAVNVNCLPGGGPGKVGTQERYCLPVVTTETTPGINSNDRTRLQNTINNLLGRAGNILQGFAAKDDLSGYQPGSSLFINDAKYGEYDFYFQDSLRAKPNLTFDIGLRYEAKLTPGAPNRLFRQDQPSSVGDKSTNTLKWVEGNIYGSDLNNFLPSIGFAWDPWGSGKFAIRGNYRLAADRINTFVLSNSIYNNIPGITFQANNSEFGLSGAPEKLGGRLSDNIDAVVKSLAPASTATPQGFAQPAAFGNGAITIVDPSFRTPMTNQWGLNLQYEIGKDFVIEMSYIGRRASSLFGAYDANQINVNRNIDGFNTTFLNEFNQVKSNPGYQSAFFNKLFEFHLLKTAGDSGTTFLRKQFASDITLNNVATIAASAADRNQSGKSLMSLAGLSDNIFRPFPQFKNVIVLDSNDYSTYHAFQLTATRKFSRGVTFQGAYTFGKSLDTRSFDPAFTVAAGGNGQAASSTPFDINRRYINYARSDFDRTHTLNGYVVWDLPFGKNGWIGKNASSTVQRFIEGWNVNGNYTIQSGRPFTIYSGLGQFGDVVNSTANCNNCSRDMGEVNKNASNFSGVPGYFTKEEISKFSQPGPGELGNTGRNYFTGPGFFNVDMAILKRTKFSESKNFELRFELFNVFNHASFNSPTANINLTTFGRIRGDVISSSRKIRIGAKINF